MKVFECVLLPVFLMVFAVLVIVDCAFSRRWFRRPAGRGHWDENGLYVPPYATVGVRPESFARHGEARTETHKKNDL